MNSKRQRVDPKALREELSLRDPVDIRSSEFLRFVIRFSEALNVDLPEQDYPRLVTLPGCFDYLAGRAFAAAADAAR